MTARRGSVLIWTTVTMCVLGGIAALTFDLSRLRSAKGDLQAAADAAALNAANGLVDGTYLSRAQAVAAENTCDGTVVALTSANVVVGNWSGTAFAATGLPRNAVRVTASRTAAGSNAMKTSVANLIGRSAADVSARTTVALINQSSYEWAATNSISVSSTANSTIVTAYDATNTGAAQTLATLKSDGSMGLNGPGTFNTNLRYATTNTQGGGAVVNGSITQSTLASTYPPGSQVATINGATWSAPSSMTFTSNAIVPGGTYVLKDFVALNCNVTFSGPTTIVCTGNLSIGNSGITTYGSLPKNLKIIATKPGSTMSITNPTLPFVADFYAPGSDFTFSSANGYAGLKGRGVFKSITSSGAAATLAYDRSLASTTEARKAIIVE